MRERRPSVVCGGVSSFPTRNCRAPQGHRDSKFCRGHPPPVSRGPAGHQGNCRSEEDERRHRRGHARRSQQERRSCGQETWNELRSHLVALPFSNRQTVCPLLRLVEQNSEKKIFVHCRLGDDRTGMAVAAYRMAEEGWSADEAMNEMRLLGFTRAHHAICPTL